MQIKLTDETWVEGEPFTEDELKAMTNTGVWVINAHHSIKGEPVPLGKTVFVPYSAISFIVVEE